jgi:DNA-directed RNA polymerase subunit RPC12/RpoP
MAEPEATHGLSCPNCGGMIEIPEGQRIVRCPFCDLRSLVRGERGLARYQVAQRINREQAVAAMRKFLQSHSAIASDTAAKSTLNEAFLAYIPFWTGWARVISWVFGQKRVGSGDNKRYEPREVRVVQEMNWNGVACDVGEFGVERVPINPQTLEPFAADDLHEKGMVFEPVGSASDARQQAEAEYQHIVQKSAKLDRVAQTFIRFVRQRLGLVYYPLWVLRYLYKGRAFQVVVDGHTGQTLYGKAPGNTLYRAAMLVGGMMAGAFLAIDGSALAGYIALLASDSDDSGGLFLLALGALVVGLGMMGLAYRTFRYGEQFEYRLHKAPKNVAESATDLISKVTDVEKWLDQLN